MVDAESWYIVKQPNGQCEIVPVDPRSPIAEGQKWGPYASKSEAIARRVGLIRSGKCQPT